MSKIWYIQKKRGISGTHDEKTLRRMFAAQTLRSDHLLSNDGGQTWRPLPNIHEFTWYRSGKIQ